MYFQGRRSCEGGAGFLRKLMGWICSGGGMLVHASLTIFFQRWTLG